MLEHLKYCVSAVIDFIRHITWRKFLILVLGSYLAVKLIILFPTMLWISILLLILFKLVIDERR